MGNIYQNALLSQGACNLSGLIHSLAGDLDAIWDEVRASGGGTGDVNHHPVVRLYAGQIAYLAGMDVSGDWDSYHEAHKECKRLAAEKPVPAEAACEEPEPALA